MLQPNFSPFPEIITGRILLRQPSKHDAVELFSMRSNEHAMKFIGKPRATSLSDAELLIDIFIEAANKNEGITWAIAFKENPGQLIGTIGLWRLIKEHYRAEIGYMLSPDFWKQGIMKEILPSVIDFGFNTLNLHSIEAQINPGNVASAMLLEAAGFIKEGHFKENFLFNGAFQDTAFYTKI